MGSSDGDADEDASSYATALSEVLGDDAPQREATQDDYTGALAALERQREAEREAEARREAALERQREAEARREAALQAEQRAANEEAWRRLGDTLKRSVTEINRRYGISPSGGIPPTTSFGSSSGSSGMSGGSDCAAAVRRANELAAQYTVALQEVERNWTNENVEAADAIGRELEALAAAHPGC